MTINPTAFAEDVNRQFLRYQLTAFPLSDPDMNRQARDMLGQGKRDSQLVKGPFISISRAFAKGDPLETLVDKGIMHPSVAAITRRAGITSMYKHQQAAFEVIKSNKHVLVSTGTGSGKTEAFLYPILDHCLTSRKCDKNKGIAAVIVYPMNALAQDQLERMRELLAGTGITFGMFVGSTPETNEAAADVKKMKEGEGPEKIAEYKKRFFDHPNISIAPFEERISEQEMREDPPRILLTNVNQLEFLLTRGKDLGMFTNAPLRFIVFDEAHTYSGARGAEVSVLIRRLRTFCHKTSDDVICVGTSATISDVAQGEGAAKRFAQRFFGVDMEKVVLVKEIYDEQKWASSRVSPPHLGSRAKVLFQAALDALDGEVDQSRITGLLQAISNQVFDPSEDWRSSLHEALRSNDAVRVIYECFSEPKELSLATRQVWDRLHRGKPGEDGELEVLTYLALGAAAEKDGAPLLRPQMHYFVRGLGGVAATLKQEGNEVLANLYFSKQKAAEVEKDLDPQAIFPVLSCRNCGQHFFETWTAQTIDGNKESGVILEGEGAYTPPGQEDEGTRVIFTNRFVSEMETAEDDEEHTKKLDKKRELAYICRNCGSTHKGQVATCLNIACGKSGPLLPIFTIQGEISNCPSCGGKGGKKGSKTLSPLRPLSAVHVADVHILAQDMINSAATNNHKLIVFADNRQDAAFQAAWMVDRARRYRLRHIIHQIISASEKPLSIGDMQRAISKLFKDDSDLAHSLAPEVFASEVEETFSARIDESMKQYLRITLIRELVMSFSKKGNLEHWGKARILYSGVKADDELVRGISAKYNISAEDLVLGIENILDMLRRQRIFYDEVEPIFSHYWQEGSEEVQRGFLPYFEFAPQGLKLIREEGDESKYVKGLISSKGQTAYRSFSKKWGLDEERVNELLTDIWEALTQRWKILKPVSLTSYRGTVLSGSSGVYQVDSAKIGLISQNVRYRCSVCGRVHTRNTPKSACTSLHCRGHLVEEEPPEDDYDISLLNRYFQMLVAREHTAQVPAADRQHIEQEFKDPEGGINCLVATPTLELGVDIGALDMVLMRNMPPLPSNYWQRAGRAGRRHRMAVIYTYCRQSVHDEYFFEDPMRILAGRITPPRFNMRNPIMVEKHVHAAILTDLHRALGEKDADQADISTMRACFPDFIRDYIFEENGFRDRPLDVSPLSSLIEKESEDIGDDLSSIFQDHWPEGAKDEVSAARLQEHMASTTGLLQRQVEIVHQRMRWAQQTRNKLTAKEQQVVSLDDMDKRVLHRCREYLAKLGHNDLENYTLNTLARGGFLPGYALHQGSVTAFVGKAYNSKWQRISFDLPRPSAIAVREFAPGNMIYANGGKYKVSLYHLPIDRERVDPDRYLVDVEKQSVRINDGRSSEYAADELREIEAIPICDLDLGFTSHVSDDEQNRFRMPVLMLGMLIDEHRGIDNYRIDSKERREVAHLHAHRVRLLNIGAADRVEEKEGVGYPICSICGAARSPYASDTEIANFKKYHKERCGKEPGRLALSSEAQVDGLLFQEIADEVQAINLVEGLRIAASVNLEMDPEDLQTLILPQMDGTVNALLYDPMPGGSGLIDQMLDSWETIINVGVETLAKCPGNCPKSCYSCMKSYRNLFHHENLDRNVAIQVLRQYGGPAKLLGKVPPKTGAQTETGKNTNTAEMRLDKWLKDHGFTEFVANKRIELPKGRISHTIPDFYYESVGRKVRCAIYLDGLSKAIHGNEDRKHLDEYIRAILETMSVRVIVVAASHLDDPEMMDMLMARLSQAMNG